MKKLLSLALVLCLMLGVTAMAEGNTITQDSSEKKGQTTVKFNIEATENYTVTIPSSVSLDKTSTGTIEGSDKIVLDTRDFHATGKTVTVTLSSSANGFKLKNGDNEISYTMKSGSVIMTGDMTLASWTFGQDTYQNVPISFECDTNLSNLPAGDYTDTLTFTVSVTTTVTPDVSIKDWNNGGIIDGGEAE